MSSSAEYHPLGRPWGLATERCGDCCWLAMRGPGPKVPRCLAPGGQILPRVDPEERSCDLWEAEPDCLECTACCGPAYDVVEVSSRDPVRMRHPEYVQRVDGRYRIRRTTAGYCAALQAGGSCTIYSSRPSCCREFEKLGPNCIHARRRAGLSASWSNLS